MKKKIFGLILCMLLLIITVPAVEGKDDWTQIQKLLASDGVANDHFGYSVSLFGDTALIGAVLDNFKGSAYVFTRTGTTWTQQAKLFASDGAEYDQFGRSVSLNGDTALIGAPGDDDNGLQSGSAYVFTRTSTTWTQQAKLLASDGAADDTFGCSVSLSRDTALIGSMYDDDNEEASGSAYVFTRTGTTWTQQAKLLAADGTYRDCFGISIDLDGDTALIGSDHDYNEPGDVSGAAYVFTRTGTTWILQQKLLVSDYEPAPYIGFGFAVSLDGDTALIGGFYLYTTYENNMTIGHGTGSAYVFTRTDTTWTQQAKLRPSSDPYGYGSFGETVSLFGDTAIIGAYADESAYVFTRTGTTWTQQQEFLVDSAANYCFGYSVSLNGDTALIGAHYDDDNGGGSGSVYVFTKERVGKKALLIGCWEYPGTKNDLKPGGKLNLHNMEYLLWAYHFNIQDITILNNPTKSQIRQAIKTFQSNQGDTNVLYMHGHGYQDTYSKNEAFFASDECFYWDYELEDDLSGFQNISIIFQCCHSGGLCKSTDESLDFGGIDGDSKVVLMACGSEEKSQIVETGSVFTTAFYKAFYLGNNIDNKVTVEDAFIAARTDVISVYNRQNLAYPRMYDAWLTESNHGAEFYLSSDSPRGYLSVSAKCPVHLHCYDTQNNHVGINENGSIDLNISNVGYSGPWYEDEFLVISKNDTMESYRIVVDAYDDGFFTLECHDYNQETTETSTILYQNIPISATTTASILINGSVFGDLLIDDDGDDLPDRTVSPTIYPERIFTPNALFYYNPEEPKINKEIYFNASSSYDEDGDIINYTWYFGDGTTSNNTQNPTHQYTTIGNYTVTLNVTDNDSLYTLISKIIPVRNNTIPKILTIYPLNNSVNISRPVSIFNVTVYDPNDDPLSIYLRWFNHTSLINKWEDLTEWINISNNSFSFYPTISNKWIWGNTTYTWSVNATDGVSWTNETYTYITDGSRYDVNNNGIVNFQDAGLVWVHRTSVAPYDGLYDVNQDGQVNFQDAGLTWTHRD